MPIDGYHPFHVRTPEGSGGVHRRDGPEIPADPTPTNEPAPDLSPLAVIWATLIIIYFVAMLFFGLVYYTDRALRAPSYEQQDGCCTVIWKAIKLAFCISCIEAYWKGSRSTEGGRARRVAATGGGGGIGRQRSRTLEEEEELYGPSPYYYTPSTPAPTPAPAYWDVHRPPAEEMQPIPLRSMEASSARQNTARDSPDENGDGSSVLARTWSGTTLGEFDAALPERPPRARLPRTRWDDSTIRGV